MHYRMLSQSDTHLDLPQWEVDQRTSFQITLNQPDSKLVDVMSVLHKHFISITSIESRPSKFIWNENKTEFNYTINIDQNLSDEKVE